MCNHLLVNTVWKEIQRESTRGAYRGKIRGAYREKIRGSYRGKSVIDSRISRRPPLPLMSDHHHMGSNHSQNLYVPNIRRCLSNKSLSSVNHHCIARFLRRSRILNMAWIDIWIEWLSVKSLTKDPHVHCRFVHLRLTESKHNVQRLFRYAWRLFPLLRY